MKQTAKSMFVGGYHVFFFEVIVIGRGLMVLPLVDDLIGLLGVISCEASIDKLFLRYFVVSGLVSSQF